MTFHRCCSCGWVGSYDSRCPECGSTSFIEVEKCEQCRGAGEYETTIGGDGFDGRCCAEADVYVECGECDGTGYVPIWEG